MVINVSIGALDHIKLEDSSPEIARIHSGKSACAQDGVEETRCNETDFNSVEVRSSQKVSERTENTFRKETKDETKSGTKEGSTPAKRSSIAMLKRNSSTVTSSIKPSASDANIYDKTAGHNSEGKLN